jgi:hypothetical protein
MIELIDTIGTVQIFEEPNFRHINPSTAVAGVWQGTDISTETQDIQDFCTNVWSAEVIAAYRSHIEDNLVGWDD